MNSLIESILGYKILQLVGAPDDYFLLYLLFTILSVSLGISIIFSVKIIHIKKFRIILFFCFLLTVSFFTIIRQKLIIEYIDQGLPQISEAARKNLIVPLPFPYLRNPMFEEYAPGGSQFSRTPGVTMKEITQLPENIWATRTTIFLHLITFSLSMICFFGLLVLGIKAIIFRLIISRY